MRIISKFKDYYDGVQAMGQDHTLIYIREPKKIEFKINYRCGIHNPFIIGFCGKIYPAVYYHTYVNNPKSYFYNEVKKCCYSKEEVYECVREYESNDTNRSFFKWGGKKRTDNFFDYPFNELRKLFLEYQCPIFAIAKENSSNAYPTLTINSALRPFEFYLIVDAYTAFQEISMYLSNVLVEPTKPTPPISDVTMAEIKGFDKFSFRKDKNTKR